MLEIFLNFAGNGFKKRQFKKKICNSNSTIPPIWKALYQLRNEKFAWLTLSQQGFARLAWFTLSPIPRRKGALNNKRPLQLRKVITASAAATVEAMQAMNYSIKLLSNFWLTRPLRILWEEHCFYEKRGGKGDSAVPCSAAMHVGQRIIYRVSKCLLRLSFI